VSADVRDQSISGLLAGGAAYFIWGLAPMYWKMLSNVPEYETIFHRVIWSFLFLLPVILIQGKGKLLVKTLSSPRQLRNLSITTLFLATNWFVYIWAVNHDLILQASLGYYINPLVNVLFGVLFLKERLRKPQVIAVALAAAGVFYLTIGYGSFPHIALILAGSFGLYGLIRKILNLDAAVGLAVETLLVSIPGCCYLIWLQKTGSAAFLHKGVTVDLFLICTALVTALPLLLFNIGIKHLRLTTMGFLQYIAPSLMFIMAVFVYAEPLSIHQLISFGFIWIALAIYSMDSTRSHRAR